MIYFVFHSCAQSGSQPASLPQVADLAQQRERQAALAPRGVGRSVERVVHKEGHKGGKGPVVRAVPEQVGNGHRRMPKAAAEEQQR